MAAVDCATQVIAFRPTCFEAYWARAKARRELNELAGALADLREAIKLSPKNMELHRFTMQVKSEIEARPNINISNNSNHRSNGFNNNNVILQSSHQDLPSCGKPPPSPQLPTARGCHQLQQVHHFPGLSSSTPKKELESEV